MTDGVPFSLAAVVVLPVGLPAGRGELVLQVEDVRVADAAAPVVASRSWPVATGSQLLAEFVMQGVLPGPGRYSLRATLDLDGDGRIGVGDLLSVASVPIETGKQRVEVKLVRIEARPEQAGGGGG